MRAGALRHVVTIESVSNAANTFGEHTQTWSTATTRRASIEPLTVSEGTGVGQTRAEATHRMLIRYYNGLSPKTNRVTWGGRTFGIVGVQHLDSFGKAAINGVSTEVMLREVV